MGCTQGTFIIGQVCNCTLITLLLTHCTLIASKYTTLFREEWNNYDTMDDNFSTNNICEGENHRLINRFLSCLLSCPN